VIQLNGNGYVRPTPNAVQHATHGRFGLIVVQAHVAIGNARFWQYGGRFYRKQRRTRYRQLSQVNEVPFVHATVLG
jgi:hypothetical protein